MKKLIVVLVIIAIIAAILALACKKMRGHETEQVTETNGLIVTINEADGALKVVISGFESNVSAVPANAVDVIKRVYSRLAKDSENVTIRVIGHTDSTGEADYNYKMSVDRAQNITDLLIAEGLPEERFIVIGRGDTDPAAPNNTKENRALNRRVEIEVN